MIFIKDAHALDWFDEISKSENIKNDRFNFLCFLFFLVFCEKLLLYVFNFYEFPGCFKRVLTSQSSKHYKNKVHLNVIIQ